MSTEEVLASTQAEWMPEEGLKEMIEAGVFYGRRKSKTNPRMRDFILGNRNEIEIINLAKTKETLESALEFLKEKVRNGGLVLFVGTQPAAADEVAQTAKEFDVPFVVTRWLGGTLTNFKMIVTRIEHYKKLRSDVAKNAFEKYTKKERLGIERELKRLEEFMSGLEHLTGLPSVMVIVDPKQHFTAVLEARCLKIPIIALANTDSDPDLVAYPIPGNTKAKASIHWFLEKVREAIREGKRLGPATPPAPAGETVGSTSGGGAEPRTG